MTKHINQQVADANKKVVMALAGGGYGVLGKLARPGGLSGTLMEAVVLSDTNAFIAFNRGRPDRFVSGEAACSLAMAAYKRCLAYASPEQAVGIASTASLAKASWEDERQGRLHHVNVAIQTNRRTTNYYIQLGKPRNRMLEEMVLEDCLYRLFLNYTVGLDIADRSELTLNALEYEDSLDWDAAELLDWPNLTVGDICDVVHGREATTCGTYEPKAIFSSSLNPIHDGHVAIIDRAARELECKVDVELCVSNADKPLLDYISINRRIRTTLDRLKDNPNFGRIILSNKGAYFEKSKYYQNTTFIVGADTLARIADPKYYGDSIVEFDNKLNDMHMMGNKFLVFPRNGVKAPNAYCLTRILLQSKVIDGFTPMNISSTAIRKGQLNV
jgi:nicotinic acid mononucleotide adenylyltransferase